MNIVEPALRVLAFLLPGFLVLETIKFKCDKQKMEYQYYVVMAMIYSVLIYALLSFVYTDANFREPGAVIPAFLLAIILGIVIGEIINKDILTKIFHDNPSAPAGLSSREKIFYLSGIENFKGKWHVIGLHSGKEIFGVIREFNPDNKEMLIEHARWVLSDRLSEESSWLYLPPNQDIEYIRTVEDNGDNNES